MKALLRIFSMLFFIVFLACYENATLASDAPAIIQHTDIRLNEDKTGTITTSNEWQIRRREDIESYKTLWLAFSPEHERVKFIEIWIEQSDGTRTVVSPDKVIVRPSTAPRNTPGFTTTKIASVLLPELQVGTKIHCKTRVTEFKPHPHGFNYQARLSMRVTANVHISLNVPKSLAVKVGQRNGFSIRDRLEGDRRHIEAEAHMRDVSSSDYEAHVPYADLEPLFAVSTLSSWEEVGQLYNESAAGKSEVTAEIQRLADQITARKTGRAAARAIYNWVTAHIHYIAVYMDSKDEWVPHDATTVLKNRFGDCKDYTILLQALLAAHGIASQPVLIDWSTDRLDFPIVSVNAFNHMIIYLPDFNLYANPTQVTAPFGVLDKDLCGKLAIHLGSHVDVRYTPRLTPKDYRVSAEGKVSFTAAGDLVGSGRVQMSPLVEVSARQWYKDEGAEYRLKTALSKLPYGGSGTVETSDVFDLDTPLVISAHWSAPQAIRPEAIGFVAPGLPNAWNQVLRSYMRSNKVRRYPYTFRLRDIRWRYTLTPPPGYALQAPPPVRIVNSIGSYVETYTPAGKALQIDRHLIIKVRAAPAERHNDVEAIARASVRANYTVIGLTKNEA